MLNNKTLYFPAMSFALNYKSFQNDINYQFWNRQEDTDYYYPQMLLSAANSITGGKWDNIRERVNFNENDDEKILLGDSGGFQIVTNVIKNTDENKIKLFNWLENNTNYAMNLDVPPFISTSYLGSSDDFFTSCLNQSLVNFDYFKEHQSGKTKYLNVLQGRTLDKIEQWYNAVKHYDFSGGWGIGSASFRLYNVLLSLFFLYEKGEFNKLSNKKALIHVLGFSKSKELVAILFFQHCLNKLKINTRVSYDSSSFSQSAGFGNYQYQIDYDKVQTLKLIDKISHGKVFSKDKGINLPCSCKQCKNFISEKTDSELYAKITYHNLYTWHNYKDRMEKIIETDNFYIYEQLFDAKMIYILKLIEKIFFDKLDPVETIIKNKDKILKVNYDETSDKDKLFF